MIICLMDSTIGSSSFSLLAHKGSTNQTPPSSSLPLHSITYMVSNTYQSNLMLQEKKDQLYCWY